VTHTQPRPVKALTASEARQEAARLLRDVAALAAVAGVPCSAATAEVHLAYATPPAGLHLVESGPGGTVIPIDRHHRGARHAR
jgi:hypothetical protein